MAKTKRRHLAAIAAKKDSHSIDGKSKSSVLPRQDTEFQDEDNSWVHVRKQRIIIWIPPLPTTTEDPIQVESKEKRSEPGGRGKAAGQISRKRSKRESTSIEQNSTKRSKTDSTVKTKNVNRSIRKAVLKARSRRRGRRIVGKNTNAKVSQDALPLRLSRTKAKSVSKTVTKGASKTESHSTVHHDKVPKSGEKESMATGDIACEALLQDSLQVPDGKISQMVEKIQTSLEHSAQHKQKGDNEMDNASKADLHSQHKPKGVKMENHLPTTKDVVSGLERNCQNGDKAEAMRSSDTYPQELPEPIHLCPASHVPSNSRMLDDIKLHPRSSTVFDRPTDGPSVIFSKKSFEECRPGYDSRCMPSSQSLLQRPSISLVDHRTTLAREKISSATMHMKFGQENSVRMTATRETDTFVPFNYVNASVLDKRVLILRKNLAKAGGLRRWLVSNGLAQFAEIFQREKVDEFCLLQLTMATLKEMGSYAVGPRRKLIHAIDCLSQPYNYRAF